jgi:rhodanese-related sulfurtransferase
MATKKTAKKKIKKPVKKSTKTVKSTPVKETKKGIVSSAIIAVTIIAVAVVLGAVTSQLRTSQLEKQSSEQQHIKITDPVTNKTTNLPITNPSTSQPIIAAPIANNAAKKGDFSYLFKTAESKTAIQKIGLDEAKYLYKNKKALFIDARGDAAFDAGHIHDAISIPVNLADQRIPENKKKFKNKVLVTYCHGVGCHLSDKVAYKLYDAGYTKVLIFFGGWNHWSQDNDPIDKTK